MVEQERPQSRDEQQPAQTLSQRPAAPTVNERARGNLAQAERQLEERTDAIARKADESRASAKTADTASPLGAASAPAAASPPPPAAEPSAAGRRELARGFAPEPTVVIASPAQNQWRIVNGVTIQSSSDAGATWQNVNVNVDVPASLRAGSAPSAAVCWIVGQGGLVLRTIDGRTWQRVPFTDASDLVQVQASDARTAQVTTADGRIFRTIDGGATWAQAPLQEF
jgi:photosystem II stability/assembly factor-like uncharacterized protein